MFAMAKSRIVSLYERNMYENAREHAAPYLRIEVTKFSSLVLVITCIHFVFGCVRRVYKYYDNYITNSVILNIRLKVGSTLYGKYSSPAEIVIMIS